MIIWVERNDPAFNNNRWNIKKTKQIIWQGLLEYAIIARGITQKEVEKATIYADVIGDYDSMWGGHKLLSHMDNTRIMY